MAQRRRPTLNFIVTWIDASSNKVTAVVRAVDEAAARKKANKVLRYKPVEFLSIVKVGNYDIVLVNLEMEQD